MNAKAGEKYIKVAKITQAETLEVIRTWRKETKSAPRQSERPTLAGTRLVPAGQNVTNQPSL